MGNFFKAIKIGYEVIGAILAVQAGGEYTVWPEFKGRKYKVIVSAV